MEAASKKPFIPFYLQILIAVSLGCLMGVFFGKDSSHYWANESLSELGLAPASDTGVLGDVIDRHRTIRVGGGGGVLVGHAVVLNSSRPGRARGGGGGWRGSHHAIDAPSTTKGKATLSGVV